MNAAQWRHHVEVRLDEQDATLREMGGALSDIRATQLQIQTGIGVGKLGLAVIKWLCPVIIACSAVWATFHGK